MKKLLIYLMLFLATVILRSQSADIGKLRPVQLISVYREDDWIVVGTDTGDLGRGFEIRDAIENLKGTTPGVIYLDTADYLVVNRDTENLIQELKEYLKGKVRVCLTEDDIALVDASEYLAAHPPRIRIRDWTPGKALEILLRQGEKIILQIS